MRNLKILAGVTIVSITLVSPGYGHPEANQNGAGTRRVSDLVIHVAGEGNYGYDNIKFKTADGAVLCASPLDIKEAVVAISDPSWLKSLNCLLAPAGLDVLKIEPIENSRTEPWKVRLRLPSGAGVTLWGYIFAFTLPNGAKITY
jgi:hypothetical protein